MYFIRRLIPRSLKCITILLLSINNYFTVTCALKLARIWHPYVDRSVNNAILIYRHLKNIITIRNIKLTGTGSLLLFSDDEVYHLPCGALSVKSLKRNFRNWNVFQNSPYKELVDYEVQKYTKPSTYYRAEKLFFIPENELTQRMLSILNSNKLGETIKPPKLSHLSHATSQITNFCEIDLAPFLMFVSDTPLSSGFMHGDLTSKNIMKTRKGRTALIDLDRPKFKGLPLFDAMHFQITLLEEKYKKSWLDLFIEQLLNNQYPDIIVKHNTNLADNQLLFLYFLYRVGYEIHKGITPPDSYIRSLKKLSTLFVNIISHNDEFTKT